MPFPRVQTRLIIRDDGAEEEEPGTIYMETVHQRLPADVFAIVESYYKEFETARNKTYHYNKFMKVYSMSLHKSASRLQLYTRELKSLSMAHQTRGSPPSFFDWVKNCNLCKRTYDYERLRGIFLV